MSKELSTEFGLGSKLVKSGKGCLYSLLGSKFPISGDKVSTAWYRVGAFHMGDAFAASRTTEAGLSVLE